MGASCPTHISYLQNITQILSSYLQNFTILLIQGKKTYFFEMILKVIQQSTNCNTLARACV